MIHLKKYLNLVIVATVIMAVSSLWLLTQVKAQVGVLGGRIDGFTYLVPFPSQELAQEYDVGNNATGVENVQTTISIAVERSNIIIYYDQWEDGLEDDITSPTQNTTQVWGDGDVTNGVAPTVRAQGPGQDTLLDDDVIVLQNLVLLPRDSLTLFYDGGDVFTSIGGAIAATVVTWPEGPGILYACAWELYPTNQWGEQFKIPVGQDLAAQRAGFTVVGLNVGAVLNGTTVQILDKNNNVKNSATLNYGQQMTLINGIEVGDQVMSNAGHPVEVDLFTADPTQNYEARAYAMFPEEQWTDNYITPRSSDGDYWLFNPPGGPDPLVVTAQTISSTTPITIPANTTVRFSDTPTLGTVTGVHFTANSPFYGVAAFSPGPDRDWGYELQPVNRLSSQVLIGWAPGNAPGGDINNPPTGDESRVYVTALTTTTIHVHYSDPTLPEADFLVTPLAEVPITSPNHNMTGASLTNNGVPFVAVWGEDQSAPTALPSIDAGTNIVPLPGLLLQKTFTLANDIDCSGGISLNDTVRFKLQYFNNTVNDINDVVIKDTLPTELTYIPGSTLINNAPLPDDGSGTPFPLDDGGHTISVVGHGQSGFITFEAVVNDVTNPIINLGSINSQHVQPGSDAVTIFIPTGSSTPLLASDYVLADPASGSAATGQAITFTLTITNDSPFTFTALPLQNIFDPNILTFIQAAPPPDVVSSGVLTWTDLTTGSPLPPGNALNLTASFLVNSATTVTDTQDAMAIIRASRAGSPALLTCPASANVAIAPPPAPTPVPTPPATSTPTPKPTKASSKSEPSEPSVATPTPLPPAPVAMVANVLPVKVLPETGVDGGQPGQPGQIIAWPVWLGLFLLGVNAASWYVWRRSSKKKNAPK